MADESAGGAPVEPENPEGTTIETIQSVAKASVTSVNLSGGASSKGTGAEDENVINLDDVTLAKNMLFDETNKDDKAEVKQRTSFDLTDQIQAREVQGEDLDLDNIRNSIVNPDFSGAAVNIFGKPRKPLGPVVEISSPDSSMEEDEETQVDIISYLAELGFEPIVKEPINRELYEEEYRVLKDLTMRLRRRNGLLNKKLTEYYKKRKMLRVFEEIDSDMYESVLEKYEEKIDDFCELQARTIRERVAIDNEIGDMTTLRDEQLAALEISFAEMQARERSIGHGLTDTSTGKTISDKVVDRLISRQAQKSNEIAVIRLAFIKRRDKVKELDNKMKSLETIGGTLHLMDFEQLRMENQTFSDKIEERDDELMRLRDRYSHAMQVLAHIRKKINIIEVQIEDQQEKKCVEDENVSKARELLNQLKIQRDTNRAQREKLKYNSGILTYPKLLLDMERGMHLMEELRNKQDNLKRENKDSRIKLTNIRNTMERFDHHIQPKRERKKVQVPVPKSSHRYYMMRPTLTYPVLPKIAFLKSRLSKFKFDLN